MLAVTLTPMKVRQYLTVAACSPHGGLAQLARAPALQAGGQRFESVILHRYQMVHGK